MKIERTKNATRNMLFGWLQSVYSMIWPFVIRTAMIRYIGVEYLGLNSLFSSVLSVLNLAELGVGSAMVYSMYKPIAEDDTVTICALMKLYRKYYRIIGLVIGGMGLVLLPFIPELIKGDVPAGISIHILYLLNLGATVLTYWLYGYKNCLLSAHQRNDVTSKMLMVMNTVKYGLQIVVLCVFKNYYMFLIIALFTQILSNILTATVVTKMYPNYKPIGRLEDHEVKKINQRVRDLFTAKIGAIIVNSSDSVVISAFLGLSILAIYQNYYFILTSVQSVVAIAIGGCTAGIGNSLIVESKEKNLNDLKKLTFIIAWIAGVGACCFLCLYQPFMRLWVGEDLMLNFGVVVCLAGYFFIMEINRLLNTYKDAAGLWRRDRYRPLITALSNLTMNLIFVQFWGIYGVLLSTIISAVFVGMPWLLNNLFTLIFSKEDLRIYIRVLFKYIAISIFGCLVTFGICNCFKLSAWGTLIVRFIICIFVPNAIFLVAYHRMKEFAEMIYLFENMTGGKIKLAKYLLKEI